MKFKGLFFGVIVLMGTTFVLALCAEEPIIPPSVYSIRPAGIERGTTATFTLDGRNLSGASDVIFDTPGITGKFTQFTDVPEKITGPRAGVDLGAQVPQGKKQTARLEITVANSVEPGIHLFRIQTPLGTSNTVVLAVGSLPEVNVNEKKSMDSGAPPELVKLPATLIGIIAAPGDTHRVKFEGRAGEELVFQVMASKLGSALKSMLVLRDASGQTLATAGENDTNPDAVLTTRLPPDGKFTLSITDRERGGGMDHFYRLNAGELPYITGVFPLGVRAGEPAEVSVTGINLGGIEKVKVDPPESADGWATMPLTVKSGSAWPLNKVKLAIGNVPEVFEQEPNNTLPEAQVVSLPVTLNGHIEGGAKSGGAVDEDHFRFHARHGETVSIDVAAARLGSALDSVIEVLDAQGNAIPRATVRCLNQTTTTLADRDSRTPGVRLVTMSGLRQDDYLMVGDELDQISSVPDQPDADVELKSISGLRQAFLGTSPDVHAVNTPVYKAEILPSDAKFPPNGLPVFHLTWRNDDGGPGYGADSRMNFVVPADGDYLLHLKDVRGLEGEDFAYRVTMREFKPDYQLTVNPGNPNVPKGGSIPLEVSANRLLGYEGPIQIEVTGLTQGLTASSAMIPEGQNSTVVVLSAAADATPDARPAPIKIVGHAEVNGHDLERIANAGAPLQLASVIPPPDVVVTTAVNQVSIEPGKEVTVTLHVERQNGFKGRVPCSVQNLPPGVRVVNVGLNGVLVTESQSSRTFTLRAEEWAKPVRQPIYVVGQVESNSSTMHPSAPLLLTVSGKKETASAKTGQGDDGQSTGNIGLLPNR